MIVEIIKIYFSLFISVAIGATSIFVLGLYFILRKSPAPKKPIVRRENPEDLTAIAGDDIMITQLDLARAYMETGRKQLAEQILYYVAEQGNAAQQEQAQLLMTQLACASP